MGLADIANKLRTIQGRGPGPLLTKLWDRLQTISKEERGGRDDGWHISSIAGLCPRELALRHLFPKPVGADDWEPRSLMRVNVGSACHGWWQNEYLGPAGILLGNWKCTGKCQKVWTMSLMPGRRCECGGAIEYHELKVRDEATQICGSTDGILVFGGEHWGFDLKTSNENSMDRMKEPYESHVWQLNLYMHLLNLKRGLLVYTDPVCRFWREPQSKAKGMDTLPVLEFVVEYDARWWDKALAKVTEAQKIAEEIKANSWDGPLPARICDTPSVFRAKDCPSCGECFSLGIEDRVKGMLVK